MVIGIHNLGYKNVFSKVFKVLALLTSSSKHLSVYLQSKDKKKEWRRSYQKEFTVKLNRSQYKAVVAPLPPWLPPKWTSPWTNQ
jgi:hypothetical protein